MRNRNRNTLLFATLCCLILPVLSVRAEEPRVRATVDANRIGQDDTVQLEIAVEGPGAMGAEAPERPTSGDFRLVQGPNVATQFQFVNGQASTRKTFTFIFVPLRTGRFTLPAVKVAVEGKLYATQPIEVEVLAGSVGKSAANRPGQSRDPFDSIFNDEPDNAPAQAPEIGDEIFLRLEVSSSRVTVGQPLTASLVLFYRISVVQLDLEKEGKMEGFWAENIDISGRMQQLQQRRVVNGVPYNALPVRQWVLFPTRPGAFTLEPWILKLVAQVQARSFFSFARRVALFRQSNPVAVQVLDFPAAGRPPGFTSLCGRFELTAKPDKTQVGAGDGVNYKVTVRGEGNFRSLAEFKLPDIPGCKVYTPKTSEDLRLVGGTLRGSKTWDFILVPLAPGTLQLPPVSLAYFDPRGGAYRELRVPAVEIAVGPGTGEPGGVLPAGLAAMPLELKGKDIRFIRTGPALEKREGSRLYRQAWFWPLFPVLLILALALAIHDEQRRRLRRDVRGWARGRAAGSARKALRKCAAFGRKGFTDEFFDSLYRLLQKYLEERFGLNGIELTAARIRAALSEAGVSEADADAVLGLLQLCESSRYAPSRLAGSNPDQVLATARQVLDRLEGDRS